jgi:hypothetical protein
MRLLLAAALLLLFLAFRSLGGPLDGTAWEIRMRKESIFAFPRKDLLRFDRGRFISAGFFSDGFEPGGYSTRESGDGREAFWDARLDSDDGRSADWSGTVAGDKIEGRLTVRGSDQDEKGYSFKGRRR